jgi:hypothetical protein
MDFAKTIGSLENDASSINGQLLDRRLHVIQIGGLVKGSLALQHPLLTIFQLLTPDGGINVIRESH